MVPKPGQLFMAVDAKASGLLLCHIPSEKSKFWLGFSRSIRSSLCPLLNFSAVRLLLTIDEIMKWSVGRGPENIHSLSIIFSFVFSSVWTAGMVELGKDRRKKLTLSSTPSQVP